ncbi:lysine exporter LysO family protein [Eggerthella sinensis]|uniref:lysine exporter LysO family protein n=1 Tax=Eggerthella sinensis TaxID=242230 RepID=UPI001D08786A|nr:lysine exporter LysO family protein [Eggerthella sinensis]MCB7037709.1 lysine exporter LysO family protein [Eggerthella sinensis]
MEILAVMVAGVLVGATVFPARLKGLNEKLTLAATALLIFSMGVLLAGRDAFLEELGTVGWASVLFCLVPVAFSTIAVYGLTNLFLSDIARRPAGPRVAAAQDADAPVEPASRGEAAMIAVAVGALALGVAYGLAGVPLAPVDFVAGHSEAVLFALMFFVGISVGGSRGLVGKLRQYHVRVLIIPAGIVAGSVAGGLVCAPLAGMSLPEGAAVASGLGWYSLAGVMMTDIAGAQVGSITFLANLLRELVSFFSIPWIAKHLNYPTCIAPAGATSEDTTLPMLIRCTNGETVVLSVLNGVICSALVPVLIEGFHQLM